VAERALKIDPSYLQLHANWNLVEVSRLTLEHLNTGMPIRPLVLRDARESELQHGELYIQDGSHTALGYAMAILSNDIIYSPIQAYWATNNQSL